jgi:hypothetical protein
VVTDPRDVTGNKKARLAKENEAVLRKRAQEMSLITEQEAAEYAEPVDYTAKVVELRDDGEQVEVEQPKVKIRVKAKLEQMTFGKTPDGDLTFYDFEPGRDYVVPKALADHLEEKDFIWH